MVNLVTQNLNNILPMVTLFFAIATFIAVLLLIFLKRGSGRSSSDLDQLYSKIQEDIKFAVAPKFMELSLGVSELVDIAIEVWRMEQRIAKSASSLPENQLKGLENSVQKLRRYLEKYDIEIVD